MSARTVLVAEDDAAIRTVIKRALGRDGFQVRAVETGAALRRLVAGPEGEGAVVVTDVLLPDGNGLDLIAELLRLRPGLPVIVVSAQNTLTTAIRATKQGAFDYLPKPFDIDALSRTVAAAFAALGGPFPEPAAAAEALPMIGRSAPMQEVYRTLARLVGTDLTVLVLGESGTGKELVARALHDLGPRKAAPFVALNMAAIPRELIESELFGHERGAFTGATGRATGRFEQAQGGTLFLDEIGDMPLDAQTRLLRVLQEGAFTPVGAARPIRADVRVVAATHQNLRRQIDAGLFREDLFYRLHVVPVRLPPLRERREDIAELAEHLLARAVADGLPRRRLAPDALAALRAHDWPGNVRELENTLRRLAALGRDERIGADAVAAVLAESVGGVGAQLAGADVSLPDAVEATLARWRQDGGAALTGVYDRLIATIEPPLLRFALDATAGNQLRAADLLGINRNTLRKKLSEHGIGPPARQP